MLRVADRIGAPGNVDDGAFDRIVKAWSEPDGERLTCLELGDLARRTIQWIREGTSSIPAEIFAIVEQVLEEHWGSASAEVVIRAFVAPCFFEALDVELSEITHSAGDGPATEMAVALNRLMGPRSKVIWGETYV
jgi:hypothetical protein